MSLSINVTEARNLVIKLSKLHRSALPVAIRQAISKTALDVKQNTLISESRNNFTIRQKDFFKANSKVEFAQGFDVDKMRATIGMIEGGLRGGNNFAVQDLKAQELGGNIGGKSLIPLTTARAGGSMSKLVRPNARLAAIKRVVNSRNSKGKSKQEKFINAALKAGAGGYVLGSPDKGEQILWRIDSINSSGKDKKIKKTPVYDYKKGRSVHVKGHHFMKNASLKSAKKLDDLFINEAKKQVEKYLKK